MAKETYSRTCVGQPIGVAFIQQVLFSQHPEPEHVVRDLLPQHQRLSHIILHTGHIIIHLSHMLSVTFCHSIRDCRQKVYCVLCECESLEPRKPELISSENLPVCVCVCVCACVCVCVCVL